MQRTKTFKPNNLQILGNQKCKVTKEDTQIGLSIRDKLNKQKIPHCRNLSKTQ